MEADALLPRLRRLTHWGTLFYVLAASADSFLTWSGLGGDPRLEGNPFLRRAMETVGVGWTLAVGKGAVGLICWFIALRGASAIHHGEPWIWRIPMLPPVRRWIRAGDRSWIALAPLYAVAAAQALAAAAWLVSR